MNKPLLIFAVLSACQAASGSPGPTEDNPSLRGPHSSVPELGAKSPATEPEAAPANPLLQSQEPRPDERTFDGVVHQRLAAGSYAYLAVADDNGRHWVATMGEGQPAGTPVRVKGFAVRDDFHSRRLDRRFDRLLFGIVEPTTQESGEAR